MCDQSCVQGRKDACPFYETKTTFQISGGGEGKIATPTFIKWN